MRSYCYYNIDVTFTVAESDLPVYGRKAVLNSGAQLSRKEFELEIRDKLLNGEDISAIAKTLASEFLDTPHSKQRKQQILKFLVNTGHWQEVFKIFPFFFKSKSNIPWAIFFHILYKSGFKPGKTFLINYLEALEENEQKIEIFFSYPWKLPPLKNAQMEAIIDAKINKKFEAIKDSLLNKMSFQRSNRMLEQEKSTIEELLRLFPGDKELKAIYQNFHERWARDLIQKKKIPHKIDQIFRQLKLNSPDVLEVSKIITKETLNVAKAKPLMAYPLSITLFFMELYSGARSILNFAPESLSTDWFFIEILYSQGHYIECLNQVDIVTNKYSDDPESLFASTYIKAQCFKKLGKHRKAIDYIKSILAIRPHYRAANSLLSEWQRGLR